MKRSLLAKERANKKQPQAKRHNTASSSSSSSSEKESESHIGDYFADKWEKQKREQLEEHDHITGCTWLFKEKVFFCTVSDPTTRDLIRKLIIKNGGWICGMPGKIVHHYVADHVAWVKLKEDFARKKESPKMWLLPEWVIKCDMEGRIVPPIYLAQRSDQRTLDMIWGKQQQQQSSTVTTTASLPAHVLVVTMPSPRLTQELNELIEQVLTSYPKETLTSRQLLVALPNDEALIEFSQLMTEIFDGQAIMEPCVIDGGFAATPYLTNVKRAGVAVARVPIPSSSSSSPVTLTMAKAEVHGVTQANQRDKIVVLVNRILEREFCCTVSKSRKTRVMVKLTRVIEPAMVYQIEPVVREHEMAGFAMRSRLPELLLDILDVPPNRETFSLAVMVRELLPAQTTVKGMFPTRDIDIDSQVVRDLGLDEHELQAQLMHARFFSSTRVMGRKNDGEDDGDVIDLCTPPHVASPVLEDDPFLHPELTVNDLSQTAFLDLDQDEIPYQLESFTELTKDLENLISERYASTCPLPEFPHYFVDFCTVVMRRPGGIVIVCELVRYLQRSLYVMSSRMCCGGGGGGGHSRACWEEVCRMVEDGVKRAFGLVTGKWNHKLMF